jgi:hypothetical protein
LTSKLPSIMSTSKFSSIQRRFQRSRNGIVMTYLNSFGSKKWLHFSCQKNVFWLYRLIPTDFVDAWLPDDPKAFAVDGCMQKVENVS